MSNVIFFVNLERYSQDMKNCDRQHSDDPIINKLINNQLIDLGRSRDKLQFLPNLVGRD